MKPFYLTILFAFTFNYNVSAQGVCAVNIKVITPVVAKPTDASIVSATCSTLVAKWKGAKDQAYLISGTFTGPVSNISCDDDFNCTAIIPVTPGSNVSWSVQAVSIIDGRTFYSYPFHGNDYAIPDCNQPVITSSQSASAVEKSGGVSAVTLTDKLTITNDKFAMYPNPVNDVVNINLISEYRGNVKLTILDASGKTVKITSVKKEQSKYSGGVAVSSLKPGLYFISVEMPKGQSYVTKFLKN